MCRDYSRAPCGNNAIAFTRARHAVPCWTNGRPVGSPILHHAVMLNAIQHQPSKNQIPGHPGSGPRPAGPLTSLAPFATLRHHAREERQARPAKGLDGLYRPLCRRLVLHRLHGRPGEAPGRAQQRQGGEVHGRPPAAAREKKGARRPPCCGVGTRKDYRDGPCRRWPACLLRGPFHRG